MDVTYHLDDFTLLRFREIEFQFHGNGNPFTTPALHDDRAVEQHHGHLASLMGEEEGRRFLRDRPEGRGQRAKRDAKRSLFP